MDLCFLTLNLLTTTIVAPPSIASKWQMGFNSAFNGLSYCNKGTYDGSDEPKHAAQYLCITDMNRIKCNTVLYSITVACLRDYFVVFQLHFAFGFAVANKP